jgi:DNA invertase Pin-like site-specific DNA recombinase
LASPKTLGNLIAATAKPSYARVSTGDPNPELQLDALKAAGCERVFVEEASGREWPELIAALTYVRAGDAVVVWKLDRLARSMKQLMRQSKAWKPRRSDSVAPSSDAAARHRPPS